jgi:hypothetical protein
MMTPISTFIRTLGVAALLALTVASMSAEHAHARPKRPADSGIRCAVHGYAVNSPNDLEFYLPGDVIFVLGVGGDWKLHRLVCGADGRWTDTGSRAPAGVRAVGPLPGVLLTQP